MSRSLLLIITLITTQVSFAQRTADSTKHINLGAYFIELEQLTGRDSIVHVDSAYSFEVTIPLWWRIRETPLNLFGGTLPAVDNINNALLFKCYPKAQFQDMAGFENWVIRDYSMGQSPKWSDQHKILLKKELSDFKEIGKAYKTQLLWGTKIYDCCYVLVETSTAYIWIDFTATNTTYAKNFDKLKEIISLFKKR